MTGMHCYIERTFRCKRGHTYVDYTVYDGERLVKNIVSTHVELIK